MTGIRKPLIGARFGKLVVIAEGKVNGIRYETCKCECGRVCKIRYSNLTTNDDYNGHTPPIECPECSFKRCNPGHEFNVHMKRFRAALRTVNFSNGWKYDPNDQQAKLKLAAKMKGVK